MIFEARPEPKLGNSLLFITVLAFLLRLPMLNVGIWFDEIRLATQFGHLSFGEVLTTYGSDNNHPLYTILAWCSVHIFGEHTWALRLPALAFGLLSLSAIARLSALVLDTKKATLITFLVAISYHHIWFSDNARGYTALLFFTVTATYELLCLLDDRGRERLLTYAISLALATWVHSTGVFVALAHLVVIIFMGKRSRARGLLVIILAGIFSLLLHAFILKDMFAFLLGGEGHEKVSSDWTNPLWTIQATFESFGIPGWLGLIGGLMALLVLGVGVRRLRTIDNRLPWLFLLPAFFGTFVMITLERNIWPRFYFNLMGFFLIIAILCLDALTDLAKKKIPKFRHGFVVGASLLVLLFALILPRALTVPKQNFQGAARLLDEQKDQGATIVTLGLARLPYATYYHKTYTSIDSLQQLKSIVDREKKVMAVDTLSTFLHSRSPKIAAFVEAHGTLLATFPGSVGGGAIKVYELRKE